MHFYKCAKLMFKNVPFGIVGSLSIPSPSLTFHLKELSIVTSNNCQLDENHKTRKGGKRNKKVYGFAQFMKVWNKTHRRASPALPRSLGTLVLHKVLANLVTNLLAYCHLGVTN